MSVFYKLINIINKRIKKKDKKSYSFNLYKNKEKLTIKIMEEAYEFCLEVLKTKRNKKRIVSEFCDLFYHSIVGICSSKIPISDIEKKLLKRMSD